MKKQSKNKNEWEELKEKLAEIEHSRWADWQKYVHEKCSKQSNGELLIPKWAVENWERQIRTAYKDLTEKEKDSDREQVDRYLPLLKKHFSDLLEQARMEERDKIGQWAYKKIEETKRMDVSTWKKIGIKYGYDKYFLEEAKKEEQERARKGLLFQKKLLTKKGESWRRGYLRGQEEERERIIAIIKKKKIGRTCLLDTQIEALLKLIKIKWKK